MTLSDAGEVRAAVRASGRAYQIGFILRYYPLYRRLGFSRIDETGPYIKLERPPQAKIDS